MDTKILSKVLAKRLEKVMPSIISDDQTGFIKGRHSLFNIRRLLNVMHSPNTSPGECIVTLDAEKAFDRVEWSYLFKVLEKFNFGPSFIQWVRLLYSSPTATVLSNGIKSNLFTLKRGTRQGCPLSPLLFDMAIEPLAIAFRQSDLISGIRRADIMHKVSLYADDLLLYLSEVQQSIPHVLSLLDIFGQVSGYKLNLEKSEIFSFQPKTLVGLDVPFRVAKNRFTYLGVVVTSKFTDLFKENFMPLLNRTKNSFDGWSPLNMTMVGRINTVKMNTLPKFLYLFQCVPVFIPKSFFDKLDSLISSYIWNGKLPRIRKEYLRNNKRLGGLGLPNFRLYYWAANIRFINIWLHSEGALEDSGWLKCELMSIKKHSLSSVIGASLPFPISKLLVNKVVSHTLRIWFQFRKSYGWTRFLLAGSILSNTFFFPARNDLIFRSWAEKGIRSFKDLYLNYQLPSFETLSAKFLLPHNQFFRYLQIRHFLNSLHLRLPTDLNLEIIQSIYDFQPNTGRPLSNLYQILVNLQVTPGDKFKQLWESDLQIQVSQDIWDLVLSKINTSSLCARHSLIQFKIVHRIHYSKTQLAKFYPNISPLCDRCKIAEGTLFHMLWLCPSLYNYWTSIFRTLSLVLDINLDPSPFCALFGVNIAVGTQLNKSQKHVVAFTLLLAKKVILTKWKDSEAPKHCQWLSEILSCLSLEKVRCSNINSNINFMEIWGPFLNKFPLL